MLKSYLFHIGVVAVVLLATLQSCKKTDGVNNNQVVETPYGLFYSDSTGALYNTNDGINIKPMIFPPDGFASRAICLSGNNILWAKVNLQVSTNSGINFNPTFTQINPASVSSNFVFNSADQNRLFIASTTGRMGVFFSDNNGAPNQWQEDGNFDNTINGAVSITSFTELQNNTLIGYDNVNNRVFYKSNKSDKWHENSNTNLPGGGKFFLGHFINTVIAVDYTGVNGAYYSTNNGSNWTAYAGLPKTKLLSVATAFDQNLLVGTDSAGIWRLSGNTFVPSYAGLAKNSVVNGIVAKENIYKGVTAPQRYVYIATNQGLYRSDDLGVNWIRVQTGNMVSIY